MLLDAVSRVVRTCCVAEFEVDNLELCARSTSSSARALFIVSEVFILVFKKCFLDVIGPQADYKLVFEAIVELDAEAAVHGGVA